MVKKINFQINFTDKWFYTFITMVAIVALAVGIFAVAPNPGHSAGELDLSGGVVGDVRFLGNVFFDADTNLEFDRVNFQNATAISTLYEPKNFVPIRINGQSFFFRTYGVIIPPDAPSNLTASDRSVNTDLKILINWRINSDNEEVFEIERSANGGSFSNLVTIPEGSYTFTDTNVLGGNNYAYRVRACNVGGCSLYSNTDSASVDPSSPPEIPEEDCFTKSCVYS